MTDNMQNYSEQCKTAHTKMNYHQRLCNRHMDRYMDSGFAEAILHSYGGFYHALREGYYIRKVDRVCPHDIRVLDQLQRYRK